MGQRRARDDAEQTQHRKKAVQPTSRAVRIITSIFAESVELEGAAHVSLLTACSQHRILLFKRRSRWDIYVYTPTTATRQLDLHRAQVARQLTLHRHSNSAPDLQSLEFGEESPMERVSFACWKAVLSAGSAAAQSVRNSRSYSAQRLFALDEYCRSTSRSQVLLVLILYPVPALLLLLVLDVIPLQDPRHGWRANTGFWIRECSGCTMVAWVELLKAQLIVPELDLTRARKLAIAVTVGVGHSCTLMVIAHHWVFPIPFTFTLGGPPFGLYLNLLVAGSLRSADRNLLQRYLKFANFVGLQTTMLIVYPAYNTAFLSLKGAPQLVFVLLLPVIKIGYKHLASKLKSEEDDLVPGLHSSVDIFDALYMTKCMQSAGTLAVGFGIILLDLVQNYAAISLLTKQSHNLQAASARVASTDSQHPRKLLQLMFQLLGKAQHLGGQSLRFGVRQFPLPAQSETELTRLRSVQATECGRAVLPRKEKRWAIRPSEPAVALTHAAPNQPGTSNEADIIRETTCLLHESEAIVVVEYIETVVPVMYAIYISILFHLPNAKYYQDMQHMTEEKLHRTAMSILIYAGMELLSLVYVYGMLKRKFGVSVFYQLAFALENDWRIYQSHFVAWILVTFQFLLIHCGEVSLASEFRLCLRSVTD